MTQVPFAVVHRCEDQNPEPRLRSIFFALEVVQGARTGQVGKMSAVRTEPRLTVTTIVRHAQIGARAQNKPRASVRVHRCVRAREHGENSQRINIGNNYDENQRKTKRANRPREPNV